MVVWTFSGLPALRASLRPVPAFIAVSAVALAPGVVSVRVCQVYVAGTRPMEGHAGSGQEGLRRTRVQVQLKHLSPRLSPTSRNRVQFAATSRYGDRVPPISQVVENVSNAVT